MYVAQDSAYKQIAREKLFEKITSHIPYSPLKKNYNFLTLSNTVLWLERSLRDYYNKPVTCYEFDEEIYESIKQQPNRRRIHVVHDDVFNYTSDIPMTFMWLDFCNSYRDEFITKILTFIQTIKWDNKAVLAITLNRKRGNSNEDLEYNKYYKNYKDVGFTRHIVPFIAGKVVKVDRMQYTCLDSSIYGGNMNVFTFLINKHGNKK